MTGIYSTAVVLWAFMSQIMRDGKEAACQSAVARITAFFSLRGKPAPGADTGNYCRARAKLPEDALKELCLGVASEAEDKVEPKWLWKSMHAKLIDGFTFKMPDTQKNQKEYPQHTAQKPGIGFPIARVLAVMSLATGCLVDATVGPYSGKETGETSLLRRLLKGFSAGDIVIADRFFCNYWLIAMFMKLNVHVCFRKKKRHTDFRTGKRLGKQDHLIQWHRPARPAWMSHEMYDSLPLVITLRELRYTVEAPGRKSGPFIIVTTLLEHKGDKGVSYEEISDLFSFRWNAELDIRSIKTFMNLNFVRCLSPEMVRRELWTTLLAYNLIRTTICSAASLHGKRPREISFVGASQYILASWQEVTANLRGKQLERYARLLLERIASCKVGHRPGRIEPRVVKRRRDQYTLMTEPRKQLQKRLYKGDNRFE